MLDFIKFVLQLDKLPWVLFFAAILAGLLLYKAQKIADSFDIRDTIIDEATGKISLSKLGQLVALGVSSWGLIYLIVHGTLTEMFFQGYMLTWAGANVVSKGLTLWANKSIDKSNSQ